MKPGSRLSQPASMFSAAVTRLAPRASLVVALVACSRAPSPGAAVAPAASAAAAASSDGVAASSAPPSTPAGGRPCGGRDGPSCLRFDTAEDAFRHVLATNPAIVAIGEAHSQKGTDDIASGTKRFTEQLLPLIAPRSSDVVVELWAPDPKCQKEVAQVASAQKPVTQAQAATTQNEYVVLGTRAKELGVTPWLLRPTCDDFSALADAGVDVLDQSLRLIKRLTEAKLSQIAEKNRAAGAASGETKIAVAYGGAMHNDLAPSGAMAEYSFGPELDRKTGGRYVELDLIVPEYVKDTPAWKRLPWYAAWQADDKPAGKATLYTLAGRSFVLVLPASRVSK